MADSDEPVLSPYAAAALAEFLKEQEEARAKLEALEAQPAGARVCLSLTRRGVNGLVWRGLATEVITRAHA